MDLDSILKRMEQTEEQQKIASEQVSAKSPEAEAGALAAALEKAAGVSSKASAGNNDAVADLMKMAEALAGTEKETELVHAAMMGQAFADAAINKFAAYDAQVKIAMAQNTPAPQPQRIQPAYQSEAVKVAEDEALVKEAAEAGYKYAQEKMAEEYKQGFDEAMLDVRNTAAREFIKGAQETAIMVDYYQQAAR